jgi:predicted esterase
MSDFILYFAHGKESNPKSFKISRLSKLAALYGIKVYAPDYSFTFNADLRVEKLVSECSIKSKNLILVGSSMGGYVSAVASEKLKPVGMFLMSPAFYMEGYKYQEPKPYSNITWIIHGFRDEIVPYSHSVKYAEKYSCSLCLLDSKHNLNDSIDTIENLFELFLKNCNIL